MDEPMFDRGEKIILLIVFIVLFVIFALVLNGFPCIMEWAYCYNG